MITVQGTVSIPLGEYRKVRNSLVDAEKAMKRYAEKAKIPMGEPSEVWRVLNQLVVVLEVLQEA